MYEHSRLVWLRLNADGVLLAILCLLASVDLIRPDISDLAHVLGYVPPLFYLWSTCYLLAGISMLAGFIGRSIGLELLGRFLMCFGFTAETFRIVTAFGWDHYDSLTHYAIGVVLFALQAVRARVLLAKRAMHITIGGRHA